MQLSTSNEQELASESFAELQPHAILFGAGLSLKEADEGSKAKGKASLGGSVTLDALSSMMQNVGITKPGSKGLVASNMQGVICQDVCGGQQSAPRRCYKRARRDKKDSQDSLKDSSDDEPQE